MTDAAEAPRRAAFYMDSEAWPGGAELWLTLLMEGLRDAGCSVHLFLSDRRETDSWADLLADGGIDVTRVRASRELDPAGARDAARLLRGFPVVHVNKPHPRSGLPAIVGAREAGARAVIVSEHVVSQPSSRYPLGALAVKRLVARANAGADLITVPSEASRAQYIAAYGARQEKVVVVRGAVDLSLYERPVDVRAVRGSLGVPPEAPVAAVVGRLHRGKGVETAINAVPDVLERLPGFRLVVVGGGELSDELAETRQRLGLSDSVAMAGVRADVPQILASVDLLIVPSESETAGLTAMEAGAAGRPVVATEVGGLPEAVREGASGLLVPPGDPRALAAAVIRLLSDPSLARRMGEEGRRIVRAEFSSESLVRRMVGLYDDVLRAGGNPYCRRD